MEKMKKSGRLNKREDFRVLYHNPQGARYYQNGRFFGPGGTPIDVVLSDNEIPQNVKHELDQHKAEEKPQDTSEEVGVLHQCPHCERKYKDKNWLDKHIAANHEDV